MNRLAAPLSLSLSLLWEEINSGIFVFTNYQIALLP